MFNLKSTWLALLGGVALCTGTASAQDSGPLIDLLVKKGIVNDQEAEDLRADLIKDFANSPAGKLNLSSNLTELKLSGDARVRYESRTGKLPSGDHLERDRFRYRFRAGLTGRLVNDYFFGFRLETSTGSRSSNVTMGDDAGPFAKTSDTVNIGQIYGGWAPSPAFTLTVGRMPNPLVTTSMVWDGDINPEGFAEAFKHRSGRVEYSGTLAQFLYSAAAASTQNSFLAVPNSKDLLLLAWQGGIKYYPTEGNTAVFLQANPTLYNYVRSTKNLPAFAGNFTPPPTPPGNPTAVNDLLVFDLPVGYDWTINGKPSRVFADFAWNLKGNDRASKWAPGTSNDNLAWQLGLQYGKAANTGEWDAKVFYQSVGAFALDPNLVDSDLFDSRTNMKGIVFNGNYALGAATQFSLTAAKGSRKNDALIAPGTGDIGANNALDKYWLLQLDFNLKF